MKSFCFFFKRAMNLVSNDVSRLKWATDESVIIHHANDRTNHQSFLKFRGKGRIPRLGSKFCGPRKSVGPNYNAWCTLVPCVMNFLFATEMQHILLHINFMFCHVSSLTRNYCSTYTCYKLHKQ